MLKGIWSGFPVDLKAKQPIQIGTLFIDWDLGFKSHWSL